MSTESCHQCDAPTGHDHKWPCNWCDVCDARRPDDHAHEVPQGFLPTVCPTIERRGHDVRILTTLRGPVVVRGPYHGFPESRDAEDARANAEDYWGQWVSYLDRSWACAPATFPGGGSACKGVHRNIEDECAVRRGMGWASWLAAAVEMVPALVAPLSCWR